MRRLILPVALLAAFALTSACGGGGGKDSPRAVAEAAVAAMESADVETLIGLMPPSAVLAASIECPAEGNMVDKLEQAKARYRKRAAGEAEEMKGVSVALKAFDLEGSESKAIAVGEDFEGCKATKPISLHKSRMTLAFTKDGEVDEDGETWRFIQLEGAWYFAKM